MTKVFIWISVFMLLFFISGSLKSETPGFLCGETLIDERDGKSYRTVQIGEQCWMQQNLNVGLMVKDLAQEDNGVIEKTCYHNDPANCEVFGALYTWHEAMNWDSSHAEGDICPAGWHIPSREDWDELRLYLGMDEAGQKMKVDKDHQPGWDGNNESGFTALPSGVAWEGYFGRLNQWAIYWSSTSAQDGYAWFTQLDNYWYPAPPKYKNLFLGDYYLKENGFAIRCIKTQ